MWESFIVRAATKAQSKDTTVRPIHPFGEMPQRALMESVVMLFWSQIGISIFGCAAFLMVTRETRRLQIAGTVCGLISNPFWWMMVVATQQWITIPLHAAYTYGWISKAYRLWSSRGGK